MGEGETREEEKKWERKGEEEESRLERSKGIGERGGEGKKRE